MATLFQRGRRLWKAISATQAQPRTNFIIPNSNVVPFISSDSPLQPKQDYFQVRVNQMFLEKSRQWHIKYDPAVLVITEFMYNGEFVSVPFMVGPSMLEEKGIQAPAGTTIIADTRVAGIHPYRGDRIIVRLVLYQVARDNYPRKMLNLVETATKELDVSISLSQYLKVADVIISGFETLMGLKACIPVMAYSKEFDRMAHDPLQDAFIILVDRPLGTLSKEQTWVIDNNLYIGESLSSTRPFVENDFVLFSIKRTPDVRDDIERLDFQVLWKQAYLKAAKPSDWPLAKAALATLYEAIDLSPDLTDPHKSTLKCYYRDELVKRYEEAKALEVLSGVKTEPTSEEEIERERAMQKARQEALAVLEM